MEFYMKLPRNRREFALFMLIISVISVNIIAPVITCFEAGFNFDIYKEALKAMPFIWISVILLVLITDKPAKWLTYKIVDREDSFSAHMVINALCAVFFMSIFLTVIGTWIGSGRVSLEPINMFFYKWPRNFSISLLVEMIIAQPIARFFIYKMHIFKDKLK